MHKQYKGDKYREVQTDKRKRKHPNGDQDKRPEVRNSDNFKTLLQFFFFAKDGPKHETPSRTAHATVVLLKPVRGE